jgi:hypothetical protein
MVNCALQVDYYLRRCPGILVQDLNVGEQVFQVPGLRDSFTRNTLSDLDVGDSRRSKFAFDLESAKHLDVNSPRLALGFITNPVAVGNIGLRNLTTFFAALIEDFGIDEVNAEKKGKRKL